MSGVRWMASRLGAIAVVLCGLGIASASPAFEVVVESVSVTSLPGSRVSGSFDIHLALEPDESQPPDIAGWQVAVDLDEPDSGVTLLTAEPTSDTGPHPPLAPAGQGTGFTAGVPGPDSGSRASALHDFEASVAFVDGAGLIRVPFEVEAGVDGEFGLTLDLECLTGTCISGADLESLDFVAVDGIISVPEPTAGQAGLASLVALAALCGIKIRAGNGARA